VLAQMQRIAVQLARQHPRQYSTAWAAQTALWQYQHQQQQQQQQQQQRQQEKETSSSLGAGPDAAKSALFLRLAESLALKALEHPSVGSGKSASASALSTALVAADASAAAAVDDAATSSTLVRSETFLLYLRVLQESGQHEKVLGAIEGRLEQAAAAAAAKNGSAETNNTIAGNGSTSSAASVLVQPPRHVLLQHQVRALILSERYEEARSLIEEELLDTYPDDWSCWKQHLHCSVEGSGPEEGIGGTEAHLTTVLGRLENGGSSDGYPLRGPHLMKVEIAAERLRRADSSAGSCVDDLVEAIVAYATMFAPRAACTFSDLLPYVELVLRRDAPGDDGTSHISPSRRKLLEWVREFGTIPTSTDAKTRRQELRTYIFSAQLVYKLVADVTSDVRQLWIPRWVDILSVWKSFQAYDQVSDESMVRCVESRSC
jgi:hypothetical protein